VRESRISSSFECFCASDIRRLKILFKRVPWISGHNMKGIYGTGDGQGVVVSVGGEALGVDVL